MKIDRYQGWMNCNGDGAINDHQENKCIINFISVPEDKKEEILNKSLEILNEKDDFYFNHTKDYLNFENNTLEVIDKHTQIEMDGKNIYIIVKPPTSEPHEFSYHITGIAMRMIENI